MSQVTYFGVGLKKDAITGNEALVDAFMKYLGCFDNPHIYEVSVGKQGARSFDYKLGGTSTHVHNNLPQGAVHDFLKRTIADNPGVELAVIRGYGQALFDADKYGFPVDSIVVDRSGLSWQGLSPGHYGLDSKEYYAIKGVRSPRVSEEGQKEWDVVVPLADVQNMLFGTLKRIIEAFDPVWLYFGWEPESFRESRILYFRDPYLFCLDLKPDDAVNDAGIVKTLNEIKAVLSLSELERILKENGASCNYEVWNSSYGGVGTFGRLVYERPLKSITSGMAALRRAVRERGVDLPEGEIEKWAGYEADFVRETEEKGKGKG